MNYVKYKHTFGDMTGHGKTMTVKEFSVYNI
jgi:hypothetical protein